MNRIKDTRVDAVIRRFQQVAPVDVKGIAEALGLRVWEASLPDAISGKLFQDSVNGGSEGYSITVNSNEPLRRKRFTIAHEIAHFVLHRDKIGPLGVVDDTWYRSGLSTNEEIEANRLAAEILMPEHLLRHYRFSAAMFNVEQLANLFKVSSQAMSIRLSSLRFP